MIGPLQRALIGAAMLTAACTPAARRPAVLQAITVSDASAPIGRTQQQARVIVRRTSIEVEVEEVPVAVERATQLAERFEGYVGNATSREGKSALLRLRVPSARLSDALDSLAALGKVTERSLSADDVTAQSVDLEARVASYRAARGKLQELLTRRLVLGPSGSWRPGSRRCSAS